MKNHDANDNKRDSTTAAGYSGLIFISAKKGIPEKTVGFHKGYIMLVSALFKKARAGKMMSILSQQNNDCPKKNGKKKITNTLTARRNIYFSFIVDF